jgi:hypothetical protein
MMHTPFEFAASVGHDASAEKFFLKVPAGIQSKGELLAELARAGKFPEYFGGNWDALLDCLRDFGWVREKQIVILHSDVPLHANPVDCRTYLETLREAADDWACAAGQPEATTDASPFPPHELRVIFPVSGRRTVTGMLTL